MTREDGGARCGAPSRFRNLEWLGALGIVDLWEIGVQGRSGYCAMSVAIGRSAGLAIL